LRLATRDHGWCGSRWPPDWPSETGLPEVFFRDEVPPDAYVVRAVVSIARILLDDAHSA
jgi:hypothetical protein